MGVGSTGTSGAAAVDNRGGGHRLFRRLFFLTVLLALAWPTPATAQEKGADTYQQACASCHQPDGRGIAGTFPPLAGNANITDPSYVIDVIRNGRQGPITVDGVAYDGVMPAVTGLSDAQIEAVATYVAGIAGAASPSTTVPTTSPGIAAGNPERGEDLFVGRESLAAGGATCGSCHAAGAYGGASLGPDLTDAFSRLGGEAGLTGWLAAPPSPTMQPIFATRALEEGEIADLVAFLGSIDGTQPDRDPDVMLIGGVIGFAALFAVMAFVFKRPRGRYVDQLRSRP